MRVVYHMFCDSKYILIEGQQSNPKKFMSLQSVGAVCSVCCPRPGHGEWMSSDANCLVTRV